MYCKVALSIQVWTNDKSCEIVGAAKAANFFIIAGKAYFRKTIAAFAAPTSFDETMMKIEGDRTFAVSEDVLFQEVSGETVLLDLNSESYFGLDEVGTRIWVLLNEGKSVGQVTDTLLGEFEVKRATLESDLAALLDELLEKGLIEVLDS